MLRTVRSIRDKVMYVVLATTFVALVVAAVALVVYETVTYRDATIADLTTQADLLAITSAPALSFNDPAAASENLSMLRVRPGVLAASVYGRGGELFAIYRKPDARADVPERPEADGVRVVGDRIAVQQPVVERGERLGTVFVVAQYELMRRLGNYLVILGAVLVLSLGVAFIVSALMQATVTAPILEVTDVAERVIDQRDFSLRVKRTSDDEVGTLVDAFNAMLAEVGRRADEIEASNRSLQTEMVERRSAEDALRAADRRKDEFLATLAHELRNPLAPLRNGLALLKLANERPDIANDARDMMERQLDQMVRLVDDLLDVSRIATGKLALRRARVDLKDVITAAVETARPFIAARGHRLELALPDRTLPLEADATRLAQVFANLLNNAARYTEPGGRITIDAQADGREVVVRVVDTGIGIDPAMLDKVFELFAQADQSLERPTAGLGVGLTLARALVALHGGTVVARSEGRGKGSEFVVRLPLATREVVVEPQAQRPLSGLRSAGHRVLVVDDNRDFASSLAMLLSELGNEVRVANDGAQGLDVAKAFVPQVAFLDIGMPKLNGYRLAEAMRAEPALSHTHLVALTGWGQEKDRRAAQDAGFDRHLVKPVKLEQILDILETLPAREKAGVGPPRETGASGS
jgi:signal transduction histidine kinase/ActR/RegA family two-component response regulator